MKIQRIKSLSKSLSDEYFISKQRQTIFYVDFKMIDAKTVYTPAEARENDDNIEYTFFPYRE